MGNVISVVKLLSRDVCVVLFRPTVKKTENFVAHRLTLPLHDNCRARQHFTGAPQKIESRNAIGCTAVLSEHRKYVHRIHRRLRVYVHVYSCSKIATLAL